MKKVLLGCLLSFPISLLGMDTTAARLAAMSGLAETAQQALAERTEEADSLRAQLDNVLDANKLLRQAITLCKESLVSSEKELADKSEKILTLHKHIALLQESLKQSETDKQRLVSAMEDATKKLSGETKKS